MTRNCYLLLCLGMLVGGIALEAPADDETSGGKPCRGDAKTKSDNGVADGISYCLQLLVYEDDQSALWFTDIYPTACTDIPYEDYVWTSLGQSGPQYCGGDPPCLPAPEGTRGECPVLQHPLPKGKGYLDVLTASVHFPGLSPDKTWDPKDALTDLGELKTSYVKVKNANGQYFAVRLSAGVAEMEKIRFPAGAFPARPKIPNRKVLIGFEAEMDPTEIDQLPEAIPFPWGRYRDCSTAFKLKVGNCEYHVTVTAANSVNHGSKVAVATPAPPVAVPVQPSVAPVQTILVPVQPIGRKAARRGYN